MTNNRAGLFTLLVGLLPTLLLAACATPFERVELSSAPATTRSSDLFWQQIEDGQAHDRFYLLNEGSDALAWRLRMIDSARHAIDMETFLWKGDQAGSLVMSHLLAAADRGVRVRLLIDDSFTPQEDLQLLALDSHPDIDLRIYNPYPNRGGGLSGRTLFNLDDFQRVDHRLHNKTLIVDGWALTVGGRNLADEYFGLNASYNFRDMELLAFGDGVSAASEHFARFWNSGWSFPAKAVLDADDTVYDLTALRVSVVASAGEVAPHSDAQLAQHWRNLAGNTAAGKAVFVADAPAEVDPSLATEQPVQFADYLVQSIAEAKEEVVLVSAYMVPTQRLTELVKETLARGVKVRVLTNSIRSNNHLAAHAAYQRHVRDLLAAGVELYELRSDASDRDLYMNTPVGSKQLGLHAKFMLLDSDRVMVGSANLDPRSLKLNTEVGLMVTSTSLNQRLRESIAIDFLPANAWSVQLDASQRLVWVSGEQRLYHPPAQSTFQQLEDWFIGLLPIEAEM